MTQRDKFINDLRRTGCFIVARGALKTEALAVGLNHVLRELEETEAAIAVYYAVDREYTLAKRAADAGQDRPYDDDGLIGDAIEDAASALDATLPEGWYYGWTDACGDDLGPCFGIWPVTTPRMRPVIEE